MQIFDYTAEQDAAIEAIFYHIAQHGLPPLALYRQYQRFLADSVKAAETMLLKRARHCKVRLPYNILTDYVTMVLDDTILAIRQRMRAGTYVQKGLFCHFFISVLHKKVMGQLDNFIKELNKAAHSHTSIDSNTAHQIAAPPSDILPEQGFQAKVAKAIADLSPQRNAIILATMYYRDNHLLASSDCYGMTENAYLQSLFGYDEGTAKAKKSQAFSILKAALRQIGIFAVLLFLLTFVARMVTLPLLSTVSVVAQSRAPIAVPPLQGSIYFFYHNLKRSFYQKSYE
jgi:hypothetical protein